MACCCALGLRNKLRVACISQADIGSLSLNKQHDLSAPSETCKYIMTHMQGLALQQMFCYALIDSTQAGFCFLQSSLADEAQHDAIYTYIYVV